MDVLQLHERIARGMVGEVLTGMVALQLLIAGLCGGKGMVAVADGEHHGNALQALVLLADVCGIVRQAGIERSGFLAVDEPAADVAAVLHEVKVIELLELVLLLRDRLDEHMLMVVRQHQDVRQLDGRFAADAHARRNAFNDRALCGADGRNGAGGVVISIQIDHADEAAADGAVFQCALHINKRILQRAEDVGIEIFRHRAVDERRVRSLLRGTKLCLGQNKVDRRGRTLGMLPDTLPIGRVRGELIAGDDRPLLHGIDLREENVCR